MRTIQFQMEIDGAVIISASINVSEEIAEKLQNHKAVSLKIYVKPEENGNNE